VNPNDNFKVVGVIRNGIFVRLSPEEIKKLQTPNSQR